MDKQTQKVYNEAEIAAALSELKLDGWYLEDGWLRCKYNTDGWQATLMLVNAIGFLCEAAWHHADLSVTWAKVTVKLMTHSAGGITDKDFALRKKSKRSFSGDRPRTARSRGRRTNSSTSRSNYPFTSGRLNMLQVGFGVGDITPEAGMEMPGGFFKRQGKGVRDKLLASACVVHDGDKTGCPRRPRRPVHRQIYCRRRSPADRQGDEDSRRKRADRRESHAYRRPRYELPRLRRKSTVHAENGASHRRRRDAGLDVSARCRDRCRHRRRAAHLVQPPFPDARWP